jgi:hypothetical protein
MASEVMKVKLHATLSNAEADLLTVAAGHTYTVLNISLCETAAAAETFDLYVRDDAGANDVLYGITADSADVDVVITYLDQTL